MNYRLANDILQHGDFPHLFTGIEARLMHLLHAQAVPVREKAPEREPLPVSKGSAFGR
ncbi:MAG: hypothetical protein E6593_07050 [Clostridium sp.]|nr:hypothetical protein [Clostridium sp.]